MTLSPEQQTITVLYLVPINNSNQTNNPQHHSIENQATNCSRVRICRCGGDLSAVKAPLPIPVTAIGPAGLAVQHLHIRRSQRVFTGIRSSSFQFPGTGAGKHNLLANWNMTDNQQLQDSPSIQPLPHLVEWFSCTRDELDWWERDWCRLGGHSPHSSTFAALQTLARE